MVGDKTKTFEHFFIEFCLLLPPWQPPFFQAIQPETEELELTNFNTSPFFCQTHIRDVILHNITEQDLFVDGKLFLSRLAISVLCSIQNFTTKQKHELIVYQSNHYHHCRFCHNCQLYQHCHFYQSVLIIYQIWAGS